MTIWICKSGTMQSTRAFRGNLCSKALLSPAPSLLFITLFHTRMLSLCELPVDITTDQLLPRLHIKDLATLARTCRHLQLLCNDDRLWRHRTTTDFSLNTSGLEPCESWKQIYKKIVEYSAVYVWGENYDKRLGIHNDNQ